MLARRLFNFTGSASRSSDSGGNFSSGGEKAAADFVENSAVYNVLELLEGKKIIKSISGSDGREHFDFNRNAHGHFKALRALDVDENYVYRGAELLQGHKIHDYNLVFKGICKDCF